MKKENARMPVLVDAIDGEMLFICPSFTTPGITYEITIKEGFIRCDCMDNICRSKGDSILAPTPNICKHSRAVLRLAKILK